MDLPRGFPAPGGFHQPFFTKYSIAFPHGPDIFLMEQVVFTEHLPNARQQIKDFPGIIASP